MKKMSFVLLFLIILFASISTPAHAQCSICTKTAGQLGEKPARSLNTGIIYLMLAPFTIVGYIGFRWWRAENQNKPEVE